MVSLLLKAVPNINRQQANGIASKISRAKDYCLLPEDSDKFSQYDIDSSAEFIEMYQAYQKRLRQTGNVDFGDLILLPVLLLRNDEKIRSDIHSRFKVVMVDEYQDSNVAQFALLEQLAGKDTYICVVGDDDQSIYSFRGTNYENMNLFKKDFPLYQRFTLTQNYRSTSTILTYSNRLIAHNINREPKELFTDNVGSVDDVVLYQAMDERDEVDYVLDHIESLKNSQNSFKDFAILYRSSSLLRNVELGLIRRQIPYKVYGGLSYLRRREVKDIIAYFKLMISDNDLISFRRVVNIPSRGIGTSTLDKLDNFRKLMKVSVMDAIDNSLSFLPKAKYMQLKAFKDLIISFREKLENTDLITLFDFVLSETGYLEYLKSEAESEEDFNERKANLLEFKSILWSVENSGEVDIDRIQRLKDAFDSAILSDEYLQNQKENPNGVTVSTIHSVKGLEYKYVFLIGFEENIFPNNFRVNSSSELEEERRIAYVAMTRAKELLFMVDAEGSNYDNSYRLPSRFIYNIPRDKFDSEGKIDEMLIRQLESKVNMDRGRFGEATSSILDTITDRTTITQGTRIRHKIFGEGTVMQIVNDAYVVMFDEVGIKGIKTDSNKIEKI